MKVHYTYVVYKESTGEYYIGVRSCEGSPHDDPYMGSPSKEVSERIKTEGDWFKYVIQEYPSREAAGRDEPTLIRGHVRNGVCLNRSLGGDNWYERGPFSDDHRRKISESNKGKKMSKVARQRMTEAWVQRRLRPVSAETRRRQREAAAHRPPVSDATRKALSESKKRWTPEERVVHIARYCAAAQARAAKRKTQSVKNPDSSGSGTGSLYPDPDKLNTVPCGCDRR